jgi:mono/diheme cytochrome c family protein
VIIFVLSAVAVRAAEKVDYLTDIQPLFARHCVGCHGPNRQKAGLRLDSGALVRKGDVNGAVVVPGKPDDSRLLDAVSGTGDGERMPLDAPPLSAEQIGRLKAWIAQGAMVPKDEPPPGNAADHWAFQPAVKVPPPAGESHPIDAFLAAERTKHGLTTVAEAPPEVLLRRVTFDLTGLPPTPEELSAFLADRSPGVYERAVDRLLASPAFGERWGRHWLDVWRYADWYGYGGELRNSQKHIWRWRDWVVESLNADVPYDRMVREMLAADEIAPTDPAAVRATGFLARNYYKFNRHVWLDATVEHTAKAFLGLTLNCARCHDHMYDPVSQEEYYRFRAFFEPHQVRLDRVPGAADPEKSGLARVYDADPAAPTYLFERGDDKRPVKDRPLSPGVPKAVDRSGLAVNPVKLPATVVHPVFQAHVTDELLKAARDAVKAAEGPMRKAAAEAGVAALQARIAADQAKFCDPPAKSAAELAKAAHTAVGRANLLIAEADLAEATEALTATEKAAKPDPKGVAAAEKKAATAAKAWAAARKAADTPGADYPPVVPSYPATSTGRRKALAEWITDRRNPLAARVAVNHVWLRHFGQPLVPTVFDFGRNGKPPTHPQLLDWLAVEFMDRGWSLKHLHRLIVTSKAYRLSSVGSPSADPDNLYLWRANGRRLEAEAVRDAVLAVACKLDRSLGGPDLDPAAGPPFRRSLYYRHAPEKTMTFLDVFDAASPTECYRRHPTVVPQQALALANSPLALDAAKAVAESVAEKEPAAFVAAAFRRVLGRDPSNEERSICLTFLAEQKDRGRANLVHVLLNHHEFVTVR